MNPAMGQIERAWMDGTHRETVLNAEKKWPSSIAVSGSILYWSDFMADEIIRYDMRTNTSQIIYKNHIVTYIGGLTVSDNYLYWMDWMDASMGIYRVLLNGNATQKKELMSSRVGFIPHIALYDTTIKLTPSPCEKKNCPELCLLTPMGAECMCRDGFKMNGSSCVVDLSTSCGKNQFKCENDRCIDEKLKCNGQDDCKDHSDEDGCVANSCLTGDFQCDELSCIPRAWTCDGDADCRDGSDELEALCKNITCGDQEFMCTDTKRCIPAAWVCDGHNDCSKNDFSDEIDCNKTTCGPEFTCPDGTCLHLGYICDGDADCKDGSDENDCTLACNSATEFTCVSNVMCIPLKQRCDGKRDCLDSSDEEECFGVDEDAGSTATAIICEQAEYMCRDGIECIRIQLVCDGKSDCFDGSDEVNCTASCTGKNCTTPIEHHRPSTACESPSRWCDNKTVCVHIEDLCDDRPNCQDGSDEGLRCGDRLCELGHGCSHFCHSAPEGLVCYCPTGMHLKGNSMDCSDPCDAWGACSQTCQVKNNRAKCSCVAGYQLEPDMFSCKSTDPASPLLIFSNRHELRGVDLSTHNFSAKALIYSLKNTIALDFYHGPVNTVYWTDVIDDKIYRGSLIRGSLSNIEVVVQTGLSTAEGLAVDWIGGNLYWVESNLDQIEVAKLNGSFRRTLIAGQMESPRAIALDPRVGLVFWTDWDESSPRIERCSMAGGHRQIVVRVDEFMDGAWPNGLTLDYVPKRIYWIDARSDSIHTTTYDGLEHFEVIRGHETLSHPFAIALFDNFVYWTDWRTNSVIRANKWNGTQLRVIQRTLTQPFDIQIMHPSRQPRDKKQINPCEINNGGCSHLCLIDIDQGYQCNCPHIMRLKSDNKTCVVVNEKILVFSRLNEIRGVDLDMPYFHTIPTISSPHAMSPSALDFHASSGKLYWADPQSSEVRRSNLQGGPSETLIDAGISQPFGLAIDWISGNMFVSANGDNSISVCNLQGEYIRMVVNGSYLAQLTSIAVDPIDAWLFWSGVTIKPEGQGGIYRSRMDGSMQSVVISQRDSNMLRTPQSLVFDPHTSRLFWVSFDSKTVQAVRVVGALSLETFSVKGQPFAIVPYLGFLYYTNHENNSLHRLTIEGGVDTVLRNNTGTILAMKIYDPELQKTSKGACAVSLEKCQHLCLPMSDKERICVCATGYRQNPKNKTQCIGVSESILYSHNLEIKGIALDENATRGQAALGPLSRASLASHLGSLASRDLLIWAEIEQGRIFRVNRDGTNRVLILDRPETSPESSGELISGLAVDWIAENVYWTDPKVNVIEVARLDGSNRYAVVANQHGVMGSIAVDPVAGRMFWIQTDYPGQGVMTARLDGSDRQGMFYRTSINPITDIALDVEVSFLTNFFSLIFIIF